VHRASYTFAGAFYEKITATTLNEGTYALFGRAHLGGSFFNNEGTWSVGCQLRDGATNLGGGAAVHDLRDASTTPQETITVTGLISVPAGGKEISLWCFNSGSEVGSLGTQGADIMAIKVGGTF
jgi:hypothetical protein